MGFNYGLKKRKFTEEWKKLYREYKAAGMSEEDIQDIYAFDLNVFRKNRTEFQRTQPLSESSCDDGIEQGELLISLGPTLVVQVFHPDMKLILSFMQNTSNMTAPIILGIAGIGVFLLSMIISVRIFVKKEL